MARTEVSITEDDYGKYMTYGDGELVESVRGWVFSGDYEGRQDPRAQCLEEAVRKMYREFEDDYTNYIIYRKGEFAQPVRGWAFTADYEGKKDGWGKCLEDAVHHMYREFEEIQKGFEKIGRYLPVEIRYYLVGLNRLEKWYWYNKLRWCFINVVLRLLEGQHIEYLRSGKNGVCTCVGEEFVLMTLVGLAKELCEEKEVECYERLLLLCGPELMRQGSLIVCKGDVSPSDWFMRS